MGRYFYRIFDLNGNALIEEKKTYRSDRYEQGVMSITRLINGQIVASFNYIKSIVYTYNSIHYEFLYDCNKGGRFTDFDSKNESCELCDSDKSCDYETCSGSDIIRYPLSDNISCFMVKAPKGYSTNPINGQYVKCDIACNGCTNSSNKFCIACNTTSNYFPLSDKTTECYNVAPTGYYKSQNNTFEKCDIACNGCTSSTNKFCSACNNDGKYYHKESTPNTCTNSTNIEPGYFLFENKWRLCDISCETCDQSEKNCTKCKIDYFPLEDNTYNCFLKSASPTRYMFDETNKIHKRCDISCEICRDKLDYCLYCNKIGKYYNTQKEPNKCTNTVPFNHFFDTNFEMYLTCDISCIGCKENSKKCDSCNQTDTDPTKKYYPIRDNPNDCRLNPTINYYLNTTDSKFDKCDISCLKCNNPTNICIECNQKYYKIINNNINKCVEFCPDKTWPNIAIMTCSACDMSCGKCKDSTKYCLSCAENYFQLEDNINRCFDICPIKYVKDDIKKICKKCPDGCDKCTMDNICLECSESFFFNKLNSSCQKYCEKTYWPNTINKICDNCISPCNECSSPKKCNSCINGYFLSPDLTIENNCLTNCPDGYYGNIINNKCDKCKIECKFCTTLDKCNSCNEKFNYMDNTNECLEKCPIKYYSLNKLIFPSTLGILESLITCEKCLIGCKNCQLFDKCYSCDIGYFYMENENKCYNQCPDGYYNNKNENICSKCHPTCMTCKSNDENSCLSCDKLNKLINGYCVNSNCPPGSIFIKEKAPCLKLSECIENLDFSVPKIFNIETNPLVVRYSIKFNEKCHSIKEKFRVDWNKDSSFFNQSIISNDKKNYTINSSLLEQGLLNFKIDLFFSENILSSIESQTNLIFNKVK